MTINPEIRAALNALGQAIENAPSELTPDQMLNKAVLAFRAELAVMPKRVSPDQADLLKSSIRTARARNHQLLKFSQILRDLAVHYDQRAWELNQAAPPAYNARPVAKKSAPRRKAVTK